MESKILLTLRNAQEIIEDLTKVCVCNSKTLKTIESGIEIPPTIVFVEDDRVEDFQILVVKDKELKKMFLEVHKRNQQEKMARERLADMKKG